MNKKVNCIITEAAPKVFHLQFENQVDTAMHFMRFQEFYESDSPTFYRKPFLYVDYIHWYSCNRGNGSFSYAEDWCGFNVPGYVFEKFYTDYFFEELSTDINSFDRSMKDIIGKIKKEYNLSHYDWNFYLIGTTKNEREEKTLEHEIAHGLFATNPNYKKEMLEQVSCLSESFVAELKMKLASLGYNQDVHLDEIQAYLSTGGILKLIDDTKPIDEAVCNQINKFSDIFRKYCS